MISPDDGIPTSLTWLPSIGFSAAILWGSGYPLGAVEEGVLIGTITIYPPDPDAEIGTYRHAETWHIGQFGIKPEWQGMGIGRKLHAAALERARAGGARCIALDTAAPASDLIATYRRWGYEIVEQTSWTTTNYESVLMRRAL